MGKGQKNQQQSPGGATVPQATGKGNDKQKNQRQQHQQRPAQGGIQHYSSFLQVLALDIDHTTPSVLLFFNKERYLFNAGEGIQRLFREHKLKIKQVSAYLITRISTQTLGGLPGMALSVLPSDAGGLVAGVSALAKGPRGLADFVESFRPYINAENIVAVEEFGPDATEPVVKSDFVTIRPIVVRVAPAAAAAGNGTAAAVADGEEASPAHKRQRTDGGPQQQPGEAAGAEGAQGASGSGSPAGETGWRGGAADPRVYEGRAPPMGLSPPDSVVYLAQLSGRPGKFNPERAKALGVEPGPLFGQLQRGQSVRTAEGREVQPHEVCEPPLPGPVVLVADVDSEATAEALAADERLKATAEEAAAAATAAVGGSGSGAGAPMLVAVHLVAPGLQHTPAFQTWKARLGPSWRHLVAAPGQGQSSAIPRASVFQAKLHALQPRVFPLMGLPSSEEPPAKPTPTEEVLAAPANAPPAAAPGGKGGGGKQGGGKGGAAAPAVAAVAVAQLPPVFPLEAGATAAALSAVRLNLVPAQRRGLEYGDVFEYDSSAKVLEEIRSNEKFAAVLAAGAAAADPAAAAAAAAASRGSKGSVEGAATVVAAAEQGGDAMAVDGAAAAGAGEAAAREGEGEGGKAGSAAQSPVAEELPAVLASGDRRMAELTFLGTASSQPSKFRNVSGCYVDLFDHGGLLVDCGEDSMGQLKRRFGYADTERRLLALSCVWVSHMHADHHGGLYRLLEWRARRGAPPLLVIGPFKLFDVLLRYSAVVPMQFYFLPNAALSRPETVSRPPPESVMAAYRAAREALGLEELQPFPVDHIYDSHGLRLRGRAGWSVVFSADTRPCQNTIHAARGATLLVHEATFEEAMAEEAMAKKHSTTAEAVAVGEQSGAYRTILTHFSTRYPTLPEELGCASAHPAVGVAMDLMALNLADLPWLPRLTQPLGELFKLLELEKEEDGAGAE